jgi:uncharacterized membrane protein
VNAQGARDHGLDRLIYFSDAVFAIAITLLVLDIRLPHDAPSLEQALADTLPRIFAFVLSFMVIGIYWLNHHKLFSNVTAATLPLLRINLLLLLFVTFLPFPTAVLAEHAPAATAVIFYALSVAALGTMHFIVTKTALKPATMDAHMTALDRRVMLWRAASGPVVFVGSAFVAARNPGVAMLAWLLVPAALFLATRGPRWWHDRQTKLGDA